MDQKRQTINSWSQFCQILTDFQNFAVEGSLTKLYLSGLTKIALCCYTTLWNIIVGKQKINDKLRSTEATYWCGYEMFTAESASDSI